MLDLKAKMQEALDSSAVLKIKLINLRARMPTAAIFVFEGVDDKSVYYHWIKQLAGDLDYVPFLCGGKNSSLKLLNSLDRDVNNLNQGVYFCVDRDFDGTKGRSHSLYVTNSYSFENHLARTEVLSEVLRNDFHFHGHPDVIRHVCELYDALEQKFFEVVKEINLILFVATRLNIRRVKKLPEKIGVLANVDIEKVQSKIENVFDLVMLERNPTEEEMDERREIFDALIPRDHYRGKFNIMFFKKFLELIYQELKNPETETFKLVVQEGLIPKLNLTIDSIASRSNPPECFSKFMAHNFSSRHHKAF